MDMSEEEINEFFEEYHPDMLKVDGHDNAIIGIADRCGSQTILAYDTCIILDNLVNQGMTDEEAIEFYNFNILGAYIGEFTPVFIERFNKKGGIYD